MLKKLGKYMKGLGFLSFISALGMIIEAICELSLPSLANNIYENVSTTASPADTKKLCAQNGFRYAFACSYRSLRRSCNYEIFGSCKPAFCIQTQK